jgi:integrase
MQHFRQVKTMQRGQIFQRHGAWHLRYRSNGKQVCQKLADFCDQYRTLRSVRPLADSILAPINQGQESSGPQTLQQFIETTYLPYAKLHKRPSTYKGYATLYGRIASNIGGVRMASYRTLDGQRLLDTVAGNSSLSHLTLIHIKSFLSGVFTYARRMGAFESINPMQGTEVPKGRKSEPTHAYSNAEIEAMLRCLKGVSCVAVTVAAYTGLSLGELQGLQWGDLTDDVLTVNRTIWHGLEGPPKTTARQDAIPLLPIVRDALAEHRKQNPTSKWVFEGPYVRPFDMATLGSKQIKKQLAKAGVTWKGWHALRRGFATRLHEAGVQDRTIQSLLRHSSLSVTMKHYVKALPEASIAAMHKLSPKETK